MNLSWVTLDRMLQEEAARDESLRRSLEADDRPMRSGTAELSDDELLGKLRGLGFELDRQALTDLCATALSAEDAAKPLLDNWDSRNPDGGQQGDWIWLCVLALWERWWPDKVCMELLDDKMQAGYKHHERKDLTACMTVWLDAWRSILALCDAACITSIERFDNRFPLTQSLFNWLNDIESELWNAGLQKPEFLTERIALCEEALRRFADEDQLLTENLRRALAETYFVTDGPGKADEHFDAWLTADPRWGWGWIGWSDCYGGLLKESPEDPGRAEELLRRGYSVPGVRDRADIADRFRYLYEDMGKVADAREWERKASQLRDPVPVVSRKVGRNEPCPCGSGTKFKKCCGSPAAQRINS